MRLFVAAVPPDVVLDEMEAVTTRLKARVHAAAPPPEDTDCPEHTRQIGDITPLRDGHIRWQTRPRWHVTLRFIGEADDPAPFRDALNEVAATVTAPTARVGPEVTLLGRQVVCAPVAGLDDLAAEVEVAVTALGRPPERRPFHGHLTLARLPRRKPPPPTWFTGEPVDVSWSVTELTLLRSHLRGPRPARYEPLTTAPLF